MRNLSDEDDLRQRIVGLGKDSVRKNYYPELQLKVDELAESKRLYQILVDSLPQGIILLDRNLEIQTVNPGFSRIIWGETRLITGRKLDELLPEQWKILISNIKQSQNREVIREICFSDAVAGFEKDYQEQIIPLFSDKNQFDGYLLILEDISNQRRNMEKLIQDQKTLAIGSLAGGIAHDFNNILSGILGFTEMAESRYRKGKPIDDFLNNIIQGALRARELVKQILNFSRREVGKTGSFPIEPQIKEVLRLLKTIFPPRISITTELDFYDDYIRLSPVNIQQIIMNLVTNACDAIPRGEGSVTIRLKNIEDQSAHTFCLLEVTDTGEGMDQNTLARIFDPYYTTKTEGRGTGLGLAVIKGLVESIGGFIDTVSEPGKGTCFKLTLPVAESDSRDNEKLEMSGITNLGCCRGKRVLIVDDEIPVLEITSYFLKRMGLSPYGINDPGEAWTHFQENSETYSLVVVDYRMPGMTGDKLVKLIRTINSDIPIIMVTGFKDPMTDNAVFGQINKIIYKPFTYDEFMALVAQVICS